MKKFFETLKRSSFFTWIGIIIVLLILMVWCLEEQNCCLEQKATIESLQIANGKMEAEKKEWQAEKEEWQAEKEAEKKEWQAEKEKLEAENKELENENTKISAALEAQLDRVLYLPRFYDVADTPVVSIMEEFSLLGYAGNTKDEAKQVPVKLKAGASKVLLDFGLEKVEKYQLTTPKGKEWDMIIKKDRILIPLMKKGIYTLKLSFKDGDTKYLALRWMGKVK